MCSSDLQELVKKYPVKLIERKVNDGYAAGNNIGIKLSSGQYIALINNDITLEPDWLKKMLKKMDSDKEIGILGCTIFYSYSGKIWNAGGKVFFPGFAKNLKLEEEGETGRSEEHTSELQSHSFISYAVFCLKKKKKTPILHLLTTI